MEPEQRHRHSVEEVSERRLPKAVAAGVKIAFGYGAGPFPHGSQTKEFRTVLSAIPNEWGRLNFKWGSIGSQSSLSTLSQLKVEDIAPALREELDEPTHLRLMKRRGE